jgi:ankyrin repeat protein
MANANKKSSNKKEELDLFHNGRTKLMEAVEETNIDKVKELLEKGANPSIPNSYGETAVHLAVSNQDNPAIAPILKELKQYGANLNQQDIEGNTPLHIGIKTVNLNGVSALLELEADINMKNKECFSATPIDEARLTLGSVHLLVTSAKNDQERRKAESLYEKAQTIYTLLDRTRY